MVVRNTTVLGAVAAIALMVMPATAAQAADIAAWTIDGGGGALSGGAWSLTGTIGQPDAGAMAGGAYTLSGGFWYGGLAASSVGTGDPGHPGGSAGLDGAAASPNPFNPGGTVAFTLAEPSRVRVRVHDVRGSIVATLLDDERPAGGHTVHWDGHDHNGADVASGVYLVSVMAGGSSATVRVALVR
jgi:hypothetical protein